MINILRIGLKKYVADNHLIDFKDPNKILLAVSGGLDSIVMLDLMVDLFGGVCEAHQRIAVAHCNFGLRGDESNGDEEFVRSLVASYSLDIHVAKFDTKTLAHANSLTIQEQARELRYDFFESLCHQHGYSRVAIAHNANDTTETMLINLIRGSGLRGLCGISPLRDDLYIRPLMFATRHEIQVYANELGLLHREDSSNSSTKYLRNFLRHNVIPSLSEAASSHGDLHKLVVSTQERLRKSQNFIDHALSIMQDDCMNSDQSVMYIDKLKKWGDDLEFQLFSLLRTKAYGYADIQNMCSSINARHSGVVFCSSDRKYQIVVDRNTLLINQIDELDSSITLDFPLLIDRNHSAVCEMDSPITDYELRNPEQGVVYVNSEVINFPLSLRPWTNGDVFCPLGMKGKSKLVSDLLIDRKIDILSKTSQLVLQEDCSGWIVWVVGIQLDERFKVMDLSKVIRIDLRQFLH